MNTRIAVIAAVLVGTASVALANDKFDANIYRPTIVDSPLGAYAQSPAVNRGNGSTGTSKGFSSEEKQMFDRAQGAAD
jgi:hypothetical protein